MSLAHKNILLGVTGSIAAYKSAEIIRRLQDLGANIRVIMTEGAKAFITPLTLQALSGHPVHDNLLDTAAEAAMGHIELARWADVILIAPATANTLARLTHGEASDLLTAVVLASNAPKAIAPAMNQQMHADPASQENLNILRCRGFHQLGPSAGVQACGDVGLGRLLDPEILVDKLTQLFYHGTLAGRHVVITAGPTREAIDPVRFLTNHSSGKMGYALAQAANEAGAKVTLISGPTSLTAPKGIECIDIISAADMHDVAITACLDADIFIGAAAVADYAPAQYQPHKITKGESEWQLTLIRTRDVIANVRKEYPQLYCAGFSAQTRQHIAKAKAKLHSKDLDMIIANDISQPDLGFASDENCVTIITEHSMLPLAKCSKHQLAIQLIQHIAEHYHGKSAG